MQAYYAAGGQPYAWHAAQSVPYTAGEPVAVAEGKSKRKSSGAPSVCSASASGSSDGRSKETSEKRDASAEHKLLPSTKRRKATSANVQGEPSQNATMQDAAAETRSAAKRRSEGKLLVSTTEMTTISNARPNLNIGINLWSNSPVKAETSGQDERELKRERRKQSNRESARRSRLRKQQECEELAQKVTDLTAINGTLRSELDQLKKACEDMEAENSQLMGELEQGEAPSVVTTLSMHIDTAKVHHGKSHQHRDKNNNDNKG
ncbi:hypothetical protein PVAP13_9NG062925 [Panicum virgatum]|uniref:BZIP domain-containing protein n=1 Tax=Panicum virgatum TaxID=38727 RepID=A0A8T0MHC7_PANVG|nr:hypothetical protein PVAP13_9NG062925 [Panicum virgatum]